MSVEIIIIIGFGILASVVYCFIIKCRRNGINFKRRKKSDLKILEDKEKEPLKIFKVNDFLTLKLINNKTVIYVSDKPFLTCKYLLMNIIPKSYNEYNDIESIDEAAESLNHDLELRNRFSIPPEVEFWGHCSNLQAWADNNYDTRLLHSNLAFPLLKRLTEVGDPQAKKVFKDEIAKRFSSGYLPVMRSLVYEEYLNYLNIEEVKMLLETNKHQISKSEYDIMIREISEIWLNWGQNNYWLNILNSAIKFLRQSIDIYPSNFKAWKYLGKCHTEMKNYKEAIKTFKKALKFHPDKNLWGCLGENFYFVNKYEKSIVALNQALNIDPDFPLAWFYLSKVYHELGNTKKAIKSHIIFKLKQRNLRRNKKKKRSW